MQIRASDTCNSSKKKLDMDIDDKLYLKQSFRQIKSKPYKGESYESVIVPRI